MLLYGVAAALVGAVAITVTLDGPAVVAAWSLEAARARPGRAPGEHAGALASSLLALVFAGLAAGRDASGSEVPPTSLAYGAALDPGRNRRGRATSFPALAGIAALRTATSLSLAWVGAGSLPSTWRADSSSTSPARNPGSRPGRRQLALSGFWAGLGFAAIVAGLCFGASGRLPGSEVLASRRLRGQGLSSVDLAHLESIWRVGSFLAVVLATARRRVRVPACSSTVDA